MRDHTIDEALVELARTMKALKALRAARKATPVERRTSTGHWSTVAESGAAKRASLDLTRKLADLRAGR